MPNLTDQPLKAILLRPQSGFKPELRSDTLWGTLCWAIRSVYGQEELEKWLQAYFDGEPPLLVSSAFLFEEESDGSHTFYLPRPILPPLKEGQPSFAAMRLRKKEKKVSYLPQATLQRMAQGKLSNEDLVRELRTSLEKSDRLNQPQQRTETFTHNTIDRLRGGTLKRGNEAGQLFHDEERFVRGGEIDSEDRESDMRKPAGLYFLAQGDTSKLEASLRFLRHMGIGGDRSVGKGVFEAEMVPFEWAAPESPNACMTLSLFQPTPEQLARFVGQSPFSYQLEDRKGEVSFGGYGRISKVRHTFFQEGSVFPHSDDQPWGSLFDVIPQDKKAFVPHPVYQYAYALTLPFQLV